MKKYIVGIVAIYLLIGLLIWNVGYIAVPTLKDSILTFFFIVLGWPFVVLLKIVL